MERRSILIHLASSRLWGGLERYALDIMRHFASGGEREVCVYTRDVRIIDNMFAEAGVKVRHARLGGFCDIPTVLSPTRHLRHCRDRRVTIHAHHYKDAFVALLARKLARSPKGSVRIVCTSHHCRPAREGRLMRRIYRNLDAIIFVSDLTRRTFLSRWPEGMQPFPADRMHTLQPSLDISSFPPYTPPGEKGPFTLLLLGRLSAEKGIEKLIGAMALLKGKRVRLVIAGTGYADYVDSLHRHAVNCGSDNLIDWKGFVSHPQRLISECHAGICVSPRCEPFSLASLEFMASGRVQLVPPAGAFGEYLNPVTPEWLADCGQSPEGDMPDSVLIQELTEPAIAAAIAELASRRELAAAMGTSARKHFEARPTHSEAMRRLSDLYS